MREALLELSKVSGWYFFGVIIIVAIVSYYCSKFLLDIMNLITNFLNLIAIIIKGYPPKDTIVNNNYFSDKEDLDGKEKG